ncbi:MAG: SPOR domain-containing protein [Nitrospirae bacterium]|nr:SPOR domain-containing protein [Nitrospirota bacterium]
MAGETILVIDTDKETDQQIISTLESEAYLVFTAPGGETGITMAQKISPSLIFINVDKTGEKGLEACKAIHGFGSLRDVPVVILSSDETILSTVDRADYGITGFLKLPFSADELLKKTEDVLLTHSPVEQAAAGEEIISESEEVEKETVQPEEPSSEPGESDRDKISRIRERFAAGETEQEKRKMPKHKPTRTTGKRKLLVPAIVLFLVIIIGSGLFVYVTLQPSPTQVPVAKSPEPAARVVPPQPQEPQSPAVEGKPSASPVPPAPSAPSPSVTPAPQSAPAATPKTAAILDKKPSGKIVYYVQIGAFRDEANATALAKLYKEKGYDAFLAGAPADDKKALHRVLIGRFDSQKEAAQLATQIRTKEKIKAVVFGG